MKRSTLNRAAVPASLVLALGLAACGAANEPDTAGSTGGGSTAAGEEVSGTIAGVGASSQAAAMEAWKANFETANPDATVNYDPQGSGAGREAFVGGNAQFAGSDAALSDDELETAAESCTGEIIELPNYISPIAVIYNLPEVEDLNLAPATLAGIFLGTITTWDAPEIAADNPDATLPSSTITPVNRSDDSGTTENFTEYLSAVAPDVWTEEPDGEWPLTGTESAQGTSGMVGAVGSAEGFIGYADASQAGDLGVANIQVGGEWVAPSADGASAAVAASPRLEGRGEYDFAVELERDSDDPEAYPLVLVSYHLACTTYADAEQADLVRAFLTYVVSEDGQTAASEAAGNAPISDELRDQAMTAIDAIAAG